MAPPWKPFSELTTLGIPTPDLVFFIHKGFFAATSIILPSFLFFLPVPPVARLISHTPCGPPPLASSHYGSRTDTATSEAVAKAMRCALGRPLDFQFPFSACSPPPLGVLASLSFRSPKEKEAVHWTCLKMSQGRPHRTCL